MHVVCQTPKTFTPRRHSPFGPLFPFEPPAQVTQFICLPHWLVCLGNVFCVFPLFSEPPLYAMHFSALLTFKRALGQAQSLGFRASVSDPPVPLDPPIPHPLKALLVLYALFVLRDIYSMAYARVFASTPPQAF